MTENNDNKMELLFWLNELAVGARAQARKQETVGHYPAHTYENPIIDGQITVHVHRIRDIAEALGMAIKYREFKAGDFYYDSFAGEDYIIIDNVVFSDLCLRSNTVDRIEEGADDERK